MQYMIAKAKMRREMVTNRGKREDKSLRRYCEKIRVKNIAVRANANFQIS